MIGLPTFEAEVKCGTYCQGGSVDMTPTQYSQYTDPDEVWVRGDTVMAALTAIKTELAQAQQVLRRVRRALKYKYHPEAVLTLLESHRDVMRAALCAPYDAAED
jgi:hypothetical protein